MRRPQTLGAAGLAAFSLAAACAGTVPWGAGGPALETSAGVMPAALVRSFGPLALGRASERLGLAIGDALASGVALPEATPLETWGTGWSVEWQGLALVASSVELAIESGRAVVRVGIPEQTAVLALVAQQDSSYRCDFEATFGPGTVTLPLRFAVDKLGRVSAQVLDRVDWSAAIVAPAGAESCVTSAKEALHEALVLALPGAFVPLLGPELGSAFELGFAVGGASAVASDSTGAGVVQLAIRGDETAPATFSGAELVLALATRAAAWGVACALALVLASTSVVARPTSATLALETRFPETIASPRKSPAAESRAGVASA